MARWWGLVAVLSLWGCEDGVLGSGDAGRTGAGTDGGDVGESGRDAGPVVMTARDAGPLPSGCEAGPLDAPIADCQPAPLPNTGDPYQDCVDRINQLRAECQCLPPLERWRDGEDCADQHARYDADGAGPHGGFADSICSPGGRAQNECPGWPGGIESVLGGCLQRMWDEGPGEPFSEHGHYINMSNPRHSRVACGFYETADGALWSVQNFR